MAYIVTLCVVRWPLQWAADKHLKAALSFGKMILVMHKYCMLDFVAKFRFELKFEFVLSLKCPIVRV